MLHPPVRVGARQETGSREQEKRLAVTREATHRRAAAVSQPAQSSPVGCREDAFSLFNTDDKTRGLYAPRQEGVSDSAPHFKPSICRIRRNRTKLVSLCPVLPSHSRSKNTFSSPSSRETSSDCHRRIDSGAEGGPGESRWPLRVWIE